MKQIEEIVTVAKHKDKDGKVYYRTHAIVNGNEVSGWSRDPKEFKVGDEVVYYFDDKWHTAKMEKPNAKKTNTET